MNEWMNEWMKEGMNILAISGVTLWSVNILLSFQPVLVSDMFGHINVMETSEAIPLWQVIDSQLKIEKHFIINHSNTKPCKPKA